MNRALASVVSILVWAFVSANVFYVSGGELFISSLYGAVVAGDSDKSNFQNPAVKKEQKSPDAGMCMFCHVKAVEDWTETAHYKNGVDCIACHGESKDHIRVEDNTIKPEIYYTKGGATDYQFCREACHAELPASPHEKVKSCCTCHKTHKFPPNKRAGGGEEPDAGMCLFCHVNAVEQWTGSIHFKNNVDCITCHGSSEDHVRVEDNTIKPIIYFTEGGTTEIQFCQKACHSELPSDPHEKIDDCSSCHLAHEFPPFREEEKGKAGKEQ